MNCKNTAFRVTRTVIIGQVICTAVMIAVFAFVGKYQLSVLLGGIAGALIATGNFFLLSFFANRAADLAEAQDVVGGQKLIQLSYMGRMLGMFLVLDWRVALLCFLSPYYQTHSQNRCSTRVLSAYLAIRCTAPPQSRFHGAEGQMDQPNGWEERVKPVPSALLPAGL